MPEGGTSRTGLTTSFDHEEFVRAGLALLADEIETYKVNLPGWGDREGKYVLIRGRDVVGFFDDQFGAIDRGYDLFDDVPFMVKQVRAVEPIRNSGNVIV